MIASRHSRLLRALQAKSRPSPLRHVTKIPSRQLLYLPHLQNRDARNSFGFRSYAKYRVLLAFSRCSDVETFQRADNLDPHKSFSCNTYRSPSKCCKQKTYGSARSQLSPVAATLTKNTGGYLSQAKSLSLSAGQSVPYLVTSLLHYFARRPWRERISGQRAKTEVVKPPRGVNSPRTTHHSGLTAATMSRSILLTAFS